MPRHLSSLPLASWSVRLGLLVCATTSTLACGGCPSRAIATNPPAIATQDAHRTAGQPRVDRIRSRISLLLDDALSFWLAHGADAEFGGFHGTLDRFGTPVEPTAKGLVQQTRHLWTFSAYYRMTAETDGRRAEAKARADALFHFIVSHYRDETDGEFYFRVDRKGVPIDRSKHLYGQSFAIYGLSEYALAFASAPAREMALGCFHSLDRTTHDAEYGGYDQTRRPNWLATGAAKDTNTHIHLMESLTNLYRATSDATVRDRAAELVKLVVDKHIQSTHQTHAEFALDFTPVGHPTISYGHDLETSWLLFDSIEALGLPGTDGLGEKAFMLGANAAIQGFDARRGGFFEEGIPNGAPTKLEKVWWVQAEAIAGLFRLYVQRPDARFLDQLEQTLDFCETYLRDPNQGEWYWSALPDGSLGQHRDLKGQEWKASYHLVRALLFTRAWMDRAHESLP